MIDKQRQSVARDMIDDALRMNLASLRLVGFDDDDDRDPDAMIPENAILGDWTIVVQWIDPIDAKSYYYRLGSKNISSHSRLGLLEIERTWE